MRWEVCAAKPIGLTHGYRAKKSMCYCIAFALSYCVFEAISIFEGAI